MYTPKLSTWLLKGTYPRLYLLIFLIIALVSGVRYHILLSAETRLCCTNQKRAEITPTPDAATPQQAQAPLPGAQVV